MGYMSAGRLAAIGWCGSWALLYAQAVERYGSIPCFLQCCKGNSGEKGVDKFRVVFPHSSLSQCPAVNDESWQNIYAYGHQSMA
jgi:hypothetical protein